VISACYLLFGLTAFFALGFAPHFIGFIVIGLQAGLPTLGWKPAPR
jgi:hypothetical protein